MKFEKISDNQIRCTITQKDLRERHIKISELTYGSEKANALFRDMIAQASDECNFEAEDIPLMIEAIPVSRECLVLLITKVTDTDELDTRLSSFTAPPQQQGKQEEYEAAPEDKLYADEILNCFNHLTNILGESLSERLLGNDSSPDAVAVLSSEAKSAFVRNIRKVYSFASLEEVISLSRIIHKFYHGENTLYKDEKKNRYYLSVSLSEHTPAEFNKVCNIISEYGTTERVTPAIISYFEEHFEIIVRNKAVQVLSKL